MDAESFERVYDSLLVTFAGAGPERRNAENLSESVGISARAMQFLRRAGNRREWGMTEIWNDGNMQLTTLPRMMFWSVT